MCPFILLSSGLLVGSTARPFSDLKNVFEVQTFLSTRCISFVKSKTTDHLLGRKQASLFFVFYTDYYSVINSELPGASSAMCIASQAYFPTSCSCMCDMCVSACGTSPAMQNEQHSISHKALPGVAIRDFFLNMVLQNTVHVVLTSTTRHRIASMTLQTTYPAWHCDP